MKATADTQRLGTAVSAVVSVTVFTTRTDIEPVTVSEKRQVLARGVAGVGAKAPGGTKRSFLLVCELRG